MKSGGLRPFFGFYGGKWRDTPRLYPKPEYDTIIEPFAGSAGYSLRYPQNEVVLYEIDPVIAGVWKYLIRVKEKEILSIPDVALDGSVDDLDVCQEAKWLVGFWLNKASARPVKSPSAWMRTGRWPGSFWGDRVRNTIVSQLDAIRHWRIYNNTYENCTNALDNATWFIDPPYQTAGKFYHFGSKQIDYTALARWCRARRGQVIVCENEGATWLPFSPLASTKTTRRGRRSKEAVWIHNG